MIKYALNIEDLSSQDELKELTLRNVQLRGLMNNYWFAATRKQLPPNFEDMSLCLVPMEKYKEDKINYEDDCIFAQVDKAERGQVHFEKKFPTVRGNTRMVDLSCKYFVRFIPNRITYRACFQALDSVKQFLLHRYFDDFEYEPENCKRDNGRIVENFEWFNKEISTNEEQMTAIGNIVNCTAYPFPYVVFGPPGTGKTSCIVECIAQILKLKPDSRIMVTAQSNSACDEVGVRLLKFVSSNKIFRFYSPSLLNPENGETSELLRKTSNLRNNRNEYPTREQFQHFNVIIVTLMSCSRLVQLDGQSMNRSFDYIFVDECAAATEPEAFVPIVGESINPHRDF
jgi:helicase MOV-10